MKRALLFGAGLLLGVLTVGWTTHAGFFSWDASVKLAKDHKKGETVKCSTWTHDAFDKKSISCEEPSDAK